MAPTEKRGAGFSAEDWENGKLGSDDKHVRRSAAEAEQNVDEALGLQMVSLRLQKQLVEQLKFIAMYRGIGYQPLVRDLLNRFVRAELIDIAHEMNKSAEARVNQIRGAGAGDNGPAAQFVEEGLKKKRA
jgi:predicted DNA binding CopG/RHH family protein